MFQETVSKISRDFLLSNCPPARPALPVLTASLKKRCALGGFILFIFLITATAFGEYSNEELANAIYKAENSKSHPYGILTHYKTTTPRQACINTIKSSKKRFALQTKEKDFIHFLSLTYCPIGCDNDNGTNKFWVKNVKWFLETVR